MRGGGGFGGQTFGFMKVQLGPTGDPFRENKKAILWAAQAGFWIISQRASRLWQPPCLGNGTCDRLLIVPS